MEDREAEESVSMQKTLSSSQDPGWNDPPKWCFLPATQNTCGTPTKRLLNKRVAFPLNTTTSNPATSQTACTGNLPPSIESVTLTTAPHRHVGAPTKTNVESVSVVEIDKEKTLDEVLGNLDTIIEQSTEASSKSEERVRKRLEIMKGMWMEDKIDDVVMRQVLEISEALKDGDVAKSEQIHLFLIMNHASICCSWLPGIWHLIMEMKRTKTNSDQTNETPENFPYFVPTSSSD